MGHVFYLPIDKHQKFVLVALADHAQDDGTSVYPTHPRLAVKTSNSLRNVGRLMAALEADGWIRQIKRSAPGVVAE